MIVLNPKFSTTRRIQKVDFNDSEHEFNLKENSKGSFNTIAFYPECEKRQGEGGLRRKNYFKKGTTEKPIITIITAVFNGEKFLEETIHSVINQTYDNVEFIIIDGGSTDRTLDIIRKFDQVIDYWISEPDKGISDAFNKGVQLAQGDYINFQGDGDGFYSDTVLEQIVQGVDCNEDVFISGKIQRVDIDGTEIYVSKASTSFNKRSLLLRMSMPHQGLFTSLSYFKQYGLFDVNNTYCMDYEHLLRAYHDFPNVVMKDVIVAKWRADGLGNHRDLDIFKEYHKIKKKNKITKIPLLTVINFWTIFKYYVKKIMGLVF